MLKFAENKNNNLKGTNGCTNMHLRYNCEGEREREIGWWEPDYLKIGRMRAFFSSATGCDGRLIVETTSVVDITNEANQN